MQSTYDQIPYPSFSFAQSHPDRLATLAIMLGMTPAPVNACRVLELGCAGGGNLMPMAYTLPGSEFVGIDYSPRQIKIAQDGAEKLGLKNATFRTMDIMNITAELGQFDYIIAHGVYSWVPFEVRDRLLQVCKQNLAPRGVAYVSYNTYPGWHLMKIMREAMLYHTRGISDLRDRAAQSRAMLDFLVDSVSTDSAYGGFLRVYARYLSGEIKGSSDSGDAFLLHDELEEVNDPIYFHQFMEHAEKYGLQYLSEATLQSVFGNEFSAETKQRLQKMARNIVELEQYLDFLRNRMFRQTLLCHDDIAVERAVSPEQLYSFYIASRARAEADDPDILNVSVERFVDSESIALSTNHPVSKAAMLHLGQIWPQAISFEELLIAARARVGLTLSREEDAAGWERDAYVLAANLLQGYGYSAELVELHVHVPPLQVEISERPVASAVARLQAQDSNMVTNLWHERVRLDDATHYLIRRLDGTCDRAALLDELTDLVARGALVIQQSPGEDTEEDVRDILARTLEQNIRRLARSALLVG